MQRTWMDTVFSTTRIKDRYVQVKWIAENAKQPMAIEFQSEPSCVETSTPSPVPTIDAAIVCDPAFAVTSARFSCTAKDLWIVALDALAAKNDTFFPMFATEAMGRKYWGTRGVSSSRNIAESSAIEDSIRHRLGSASNRLLTALFISQTSNISPSTVYRGKAASSGCVFAIYLANSTPPSWPSPSLITQFSAAASGMDPAPSPTA